jgi:hypothetical protein
MDMDADGPTGEAANFAKYAAAEACAKAVDLAIHIHGTGQAALRTRIRAAVLPVLDGLGEIDTALPHGRAGERIRPHVRAIRVAWRHESSTGGTTSGRENGMHALRRTVAVATLLVLLGLVAGFGVSVANDEERLRGSALAPTAMEYAVMLVV